MFNDLQQQRTGLRSKERSRLVVTVAVCLVLGGAIYGAGRFTKDEAPLPNLPDAGAHAAAKEALHELDLAPFAALRAGTVGPAAFDGRALDHALEEIASGQARAGPEARPRAQGRPRARPEGGGGDAPRGPRDRAEPREGGLRLARQPRRRPALVVRPRGRRRGPHRRRAGGAVLQSRGRPAPGPPHGRGGADASSRTGTSSGCAASTCSSARARSARSTWTSRPRSWSGASTG